MSDLVNVSVDKMRGLSKDDCYEFANACIQYAVYLQRVENRESAKLSVCNGIIAKIAGKNWANYDVVATTDIRLNVIAAENPKLKEYLDKRMEHSAYLAEIKWVN